MRADDKSTDESISDYLLVGALMLGFLYLAHSCAPQEPVRRDLPPLYYYFHKRMFMVCERAIENNEHRRGGDQRRGDKMSIDDRIL